MRKPMICALAVCLLLLGMPLKCLAAEEGSIRVWLGQEGNVVSGGSVVLYEVGQAISGGYRLSEEFGGGAVTWEDSYSMALAAWLAEQAESGGREIQLDADGYGDFTGLTPGLYLLVQGQSVPGYCAIEPFLVEMPYEGEWELQANPRMRKLPAVTPETGDNFFPVLACYAMAASGLGIAVLVRRKNQGK